jgi:rSAM/selenodomain-associated transferase 2
MNVIIPTWNAATTLPATLATLAEAPCRIIVADAHSPDGTADIARSLGAEVVQAPRGRGAQLAAGAAASRAHWLLFLHADTRLEPGWSKAAQAFMAGPPGAAHFTFALDDASPPARRLERAVAWRCRHLSLPYGDQGLLIHRRLYQAMGGFRPMPLMEDVDLIRRLRPVRPVALAPRAITSSHKWQKHGFMLRSAKNLSILALYFAGVPPRWLVRIY